MCFRLARAEDSGIEANSVDLVTVAQALHWFDIDAFMQEAGRVLKPGGVLAAWSYHHCRVSPQIDTVVEAVFAEVEAFWPPERTLVENRYRDIRLPFAEIPAGEFCMQASWTADNMLDYMRTWSASQRYIAANGKDPTEGYAGALQALWGAGNRAVRWPVILRLGRK